MSVEYGYLSKEGFSDVYQCFLEAFADYHVDMSYMNQPRMFNRMLKNGVDFGASVGAYENGKMVGATLIGIGDWNGEKAAFDAGTGIIPSHRGKGVAGGMFRFSLPGIKNKGIRKFLLEVLRVNEAGIKAYQKTGFKITRELDCFELHPEHFKPLQKTPSGITIEPVNTDILEQFSGHLDWQPSWENSFSSIARIPDGVDIYGAFEKGQPIGLAVYYPSLMWLMAVVVDPAHRRRGIGGQLVAHCIAHLPKGTKSIKAHNIDSKETGTHQLFRQLGFKEIIGQYEMAMDI